MHRNCNAVSFVPRNRGSSKSADPEMPGIMCGKDPRPVRLRYSEMTPFGSSVSKLAHNTESKAWRESCFRLTPTGSASEKW
jgi:hypothetical protein